MSLDSVERIYVDDLFEYHDDAGSIISFAYVFAFGERLAYRIVPGGAALRAEAAWIIPWLPQNLALLLLGLGAAATLCGWAARAGVWVQVARRPAPAGLAGVLIVGIAFYPVPAESGGGGPDLRYRFLISDPVGSAIVEVNWSGNRVRHTVFRPFGLIHEEEWWYGVARFFAGHPRQEELGLHYMQARWYDAEAGRFLSVDPVIRNIASPQAHNSYSYVENRPTSLVDPTGEQPKPPRGGSGRGDPSYRPRKTRSAPATQSSGLPSIAPSPRSTPASRGANALGLALDTAARVGRALGPVPRTVEAKSQRLIEEKRLSVNEDFPNLDPRDFDVVAFEFFLEKDFRPFGGFEIVDVAVVAVPVPRGQDPVRPPFAVLSDPPLTVSPYQRRPVCLRCTPSLVPHPEDRPAPDPEPTLEPEPVPAPEPVDQESQRKELILIIEGQLQYPGPIQWKTTTGRLFFPPLGGGKGR